MSARDAFEILVSHLGEDAPATVPARVHPLATVHASVLLADGVVVQAGAYLAAGVELGRGVRVEPNAVFVDPEPGSRSRTVVKEGARIGAHALVHAGVTIAARAVVRPGAVVTRSVPPGAMVEGHPAVIVGYVGAALSTAGASLNAPAATGIVTTEVRGVSIHQMALVHDLRGDLTAGEFNRQIPFTPQRYFMVLGVPSREVRGEHAHRECHQFLVCVKGSCSVIADDGRHKVEVLLDAPQRGIYLPPMVWGIQYRYSADAVLMVFASHHYDPADYIRDYDEYLALVQVKATAASAARARDGALHV